MRYLAPLLALALLASPATADDSNRWSSKEHNLKLQLPSSWSLRTDKAQKWGTENGLVEGRSADSKAACILAWEETGHTTKAYTKNWEAITRETKKLTKHYEKEIDRGEGEWVRVEYTWESPKTTFIYIVEFVSVGDRTYRLVIWYLKSMEKAFRGAANAILDSFGQHVKKPVPPPTPKGAAKPWSSAEHGLELKVPGGWKHRSGKAMQWGADGAILEGLSRDGNGAFILAYEDVNLTSERYLVEWETSQRENKKLTSKSKKQLEPGDRYRAEYVWENPGATFVYIVELLTVGKRTYRLIMWYVKSEEEDFRPDANTLLDGFRRTETAKQD